MSEKSDPTLAASGQDFKQLVQAGLNWLQLHQEAVNALNVFPVPDGDTGTNMVLTMRSAWNEVADVTEQHVGRVAHGVAHGALMGARGNSGVILSQIWRGLARGLEGKVSLNGADLAEAIQEGAETAYRGVIRPVEGTILTVVREAAEEALEATEVSTDLLYVFEHMLRRARDAVARTPDLLPVLAEAGVVDAGGQGLYLILEGMLRRLKGDSEVESVRFVEGTQQMERHAHVPLGTAEQGYGYDVQFIVVGNGMNVPVIREEIDRMGDCALVVGDPNTVKVHVHVPDPGVPLSYAVRLGSLRDVVIEDMQAQSEEFAVDHQQVPSPPAPLNVSGIGLVAVASGNGLARVFQSLGVGGIVHGGQTMNPSTEELLQAVESLPNERVILLPNNKNIIMSAEQARDLSSKEVGLVPTRTIPQGIAAVLALNPQADVEANVQSMLAAAREVLTAEITTAVRDVNLNGVTVYEGQTIGILDGELIMAGNEPEYVVYKVVECMEPEELEILTLYYGADISPTEAEELAAQLQVRYPDLEFEVLEGGQRHYYYIISAE